MGEHTESQSDSFPRLISGTAKVRTPNLGCSFYYMFFLHPYGTKWPQSTLGKVNPRHILDGVSGQPLANKLLWS